MNDSERDSVLKSISIGLGFCVIFSFIIFLFQGFDLSWVFISYFVIVFMIVRYVRKGFFDTLFYTVYLAALIFQGFILSYSYLMPKINGSGRIQFYIYSGIFVLQIVSYLIIIYYDKIKDRK